MKTAVESSATGVLPPVATAVSTQERTTSPQQRATAILVKCPGCRELLYYKDLIRNLKVCRSCNYHFRMKAAERIQSLFDSDSFREFAQGMRAIDPLHFIGLSQSYAEKLEQERMLSELNEAVVIGSGRIEQLPLVGAVMDFHFIGGSMGSVVGEKVTRAAEYALRERLPLLIISASGGARMQEGLYSLLQMTKTAAALARLGRTGIPFISLLTDPTTGGVAASFALLGDVILAEPGALIGFAGPRVIEQFMHQRLPEEANTAEFVFQHGMIDGIIHRHELRPTLARLLRLYRRARVPGRDDAAQINARDGGNFYDL